MNTANRSDLPQGLDAYERLVAGIREGEFAPGDRLREAEIARRFGISRTPVREAIRRLEAEDLVTHIPRVGAAIRKLDHAEVTELYEMRAALEGTTARLAARGASEVELSELRAINGDMGEALEAGEPLHALNRRFHAAMLDAAKNRFLLKSVRAIEKTLLILGPSTLDEEDRAAEAVAEHAAVLEALAGRDAAAAETAMRVHIEAAHRMRLRQLRRTV